LCGKSKGCWRGQKANGKNAGIIFEKAITATENTDTLLLHRLSAAFTCNAASLMKTPEQCFCAICGKKHAAEQPASRKNRFLDSVLTGSAFKNTFSALFLLAAASNISSTKLFYVHYRL
jgi:hypothetical protein